MGPVRGTGWGGQTKSQMGKFPWDPDFMKNYDFSLKSWFSTKIKIFQSKIMIFIVKSGFFIRKIVMFHWTIMIFQWKIMMFRWKIMIFAWKNMIFQWKSWFFIENHDFLMKSCFFNENLNFSWKITMFHAIWDSWKLTISNAFKPPERSAEIGPIVLRKTQIHWAGPLELSGRQVV